MSKIGNSNMNPLFYSQFDVNFMTLNQNKHDQFMIKAILTVSLCTEY